MWLLKKCDVNDNSFTHLTLILSLHYLWSCDREMGYRHTHFLQSQFLANPPFFANSVPCKFHSLQIHAHANFSGLCLNFPFLAIFTPFPCKFSAPIRLPVRYTSPGVDLVVQWGSWALEVSQASGHLGLGRQYFGLQLQIPAKGTVVKGRCANVAMSEKRMSM